MKNNKKNKPCHNDFRLYFDIYDKKIDFLCQELIISKEEIHQLILNNIKLEYKLNQIIKSNN